MKKRFLVVLSIWLILMPFYVGHGLRDAWNSSKAENGPRFVFSMFEDINKDTLVSLIDNEEIAFAGIAGDSLYIETVSGSQYTYVDTMKEMQSYLLFKGIDVAQMGSMSFRDRIDETQASIRKNVIVKASVRLLIGGAILAVIGWLLCTWTTKEAQKRAAEEIQKYPPVAQKAVVESVVSESKSEVPQVTFDDVQGIEELKSDLKRLVDCLKNPDKYYAIGARPPKGVILYGPPGTGKTLMAKAIAGEAGVPFFFMNGSDFVELYVGIGAKRVRELYAKARKNAPCIVFIDEIDAVAAHRGQNDSSERDQTINALLNELDGFNGHEAVMTICATNRLESLDDAFKRAGRFDLKLAVALPDMTSREKILQQHTKKKKLADDVNLHDIAKRCIGFSGAELEALMNEAAMIAVANDRQAISLSDVDDAFFKLVMQGNKKPRDHIDEMNRLVAWHEAGHTLATKLLTEDSVPSVTIVGSYSGAGGVTFRVPKEQTLQSRKYLRNMVAVMYAGRAAESLYLDDPDQITIGASQDIREATRLIKDYLSVYGMGDLGMLDLIQLRKDYGDIVHEASTLAKDIYSEVLQLLSEHKVVLERLASALCEKETLNESEIDTLINEA